MVDNQAAIYVGMHDSTSRKLKHITVRFNNVREKVCEGVVTLKYISTKEQIADILTKCLGKSIFLYLRKFLVG